MLILSNFVKSSGFVSSGPMRPVIAVFERFSDCWERNVLRWCLKKGSYL